MTLTNVNPPKSVQSASAALARGDWAAAMTGLLSEQQSRSLSPGELDLLARAAYGAGEFELAITSWERAHADQLRADDPDGAATSAVTIAMYLMMDTGLMAPVRGWMARAERLLTGPEGPTTALLALTHTYERFLSGDAEQARFWSSRSIELGHRHGVPLAAALGRTAAARLVLLDADVDHGLALLDEAAVSVMSGELDPLGTGMVYCELICAMQNLAQYDRAEQWTEAMERWRVGRAFGGINGRCRVHRAEILRLRGSCTEAEDEALHACRELRPWMRREFGWPLTELGGIRLRRGDLAGAEEAFLEALGHGWDPQPGLAMLRLAQGRVRTAAELIAAALQHPCAVPSKERPPHGELRRAPLLEAHVEIAVAAGDLAGAAAAAAELSGIGERFRSRALCAAASVARARVALAQDEVALARRECTDAVGAWLDLGAPYEVDVARALLAEVDRRPGPRPGRFVEVEATESPIVTIPAPRPATTESGSFRLTGDTRAIDFAGRTVLLHDLKGMRYLARLLSAPGREFHVLDLVGTEGLSIRTAEAGLGPTLDDQARDAYKRRLREIDDDIEEATGLGDQVRVLAAEADREYLVRELARAFGLGGRHRPQAASSERARVSVSRALRYAFDRVGAHHPELSEHLRRSVRTGTYCAYEPDPRAPMSWQL